MRALPAAVLALILAACGPSDPQAPAAPAGPAATPARAPAPVAYPEVEPIAPGLPGGLPDDRTPISEAPFSPTSAQGAANAMQTYFASIGQKDYARAWSLWSAGGAASNMTADQYAASFGRYVQYNAQVGAPGEIEGAAGSLYVTVPVQIYGRLSTGEPFHQRGDATLRRVNDVPGSTESQRQWRIASIDAQAVP